MTQTTASAAGHDEILIDQSAIDRIKAMRADPNNSHFGPGTMLRVAVSSGGCSGFQYIMEAADEAEDDDRVYDGVVVIDETSQDILKGSKIVFKDDMMGAQFIVDNPNAKSGCGCGTSFSL